MIVVFLFHFSFCAKKGGEEGRGYRKVLGTEERINERGGERIKERGGERKKEGGGGGRKEGGGGGKVVSVVVLLRIMRRMS